MNKQNKELRIVMFKNNDTIKSLSEYLDMKSSRSLSDRLNGKKPFNSDEIRKIADKYQLSGEEILYFFNLKSTSKVRGRKWKH